MLRRFIGNPVIPIRPGRWRCFAARSALVIAALVAAAALATPCSADLLISAPAFSAPQGSSGAFDVLITNTNAPGGTSFNVAADDLQLSVTGPAGITFTLASIATITPYIYVSSGTLPVNGGGPFSFDVFPNTTFLASDSEFNPPGYRTIQGGDIFGLAHVDYTIAPGAALGVRNLVIGASTDLTDGTDPNNPVLIPFTSSQGTINVTAGTPSTPEPSALVLLATGAGLGLIGFARRRR